MAICQGDSTLLDAGSGHTNYLWNTVKLPKPSMPILLGRIVTVGNGVPIVNSNSLSFDGTDDFISLTNSSGLNFENLNNITLSTWINPANLVGQTGIITSMSNIIGTGMFVISYFETQWKDYFFQVIQIMFRT